jgi:hypothetical protein
MDSGPFTVDTLMPGCCMAMHNDMEPDKTEKVVRFGCGFVFGLVIGFFTAITCVIESWSIVVLIAFGAAVLFGWLAKKYGDAFWNSMKNWWYWT